MMMMMVMIMIVYVPTIPFLLLYVVKNNCKNSFVTCYNYLTILITYVVTLSPCQGRLLLVKYINT